MASGLTQATNLAAKLTASVDLDETVVTVGTTPLLYAIELDNTANSAEVFVKLFDASSVTLGTTEPDEMIPVPALTKIVYVPNGEDGISFLVALKAVCVASNATSSTTGPTNPVKAEFRTDGN